LASIPVGWRANKKQQREREAGGLPSNLKSVKSNLLPAYEYVIITSNDLKLKDAFKDYLPEELYHRGKQGFEVQLPAANRVT